MSAELLLRSLLREIALIDEGARARLASVLPQDLPEAAFGVLQHLVMTTNRDETPADLARLFRVSRPAMSQTLARLQRAGHVRLVPSTEDRRVRRVEVTDAGRRAHEAVYGALAEDLRELSRGQDSERLAGLLATLRELRERVERLAPRTEVPDRRPGSDPLPGPSEEP